MYKTLSLKNFTFALYMQNSFSYKTLHNRKILHFSRWSRKTYAVFLSLNKVIKISNLKTEVAQCFIQKNKSFTEVQTFLSFNKNEPYKVFPDIIALLNQNILVTLVTQLNNLSNGNINKKHLFFRN